MEKRNVATESRVRDSESADMAIAAAVACIEQAQGIIKRATEDVNQIKISMESMKKAMEEDEKADKEG